MSLELDHVFLCPDDPAAAERLLSEFGLELSRRGIHPGQGTANACAFFDNAYLELLWRHDDAELQSDPVRPLALWERVRPRATGASPFGISFRPGPGSEGEPALATWPYAAAYLPEGASIPVLTPPDRPNEPLVFLSLVSQAPETIPADRRPPLEHRGRRRRLTGVRLTLPHAAPSDALRAIRDAGLLTLAEGAHHLELQWDGGRSGRCHDFRPELPLTIRA